MPVTLTKLTWEIDAVGAAEGTFGFTVSGSSGVLYHRSPSYESKTGHLYIEGAADEIKFHTNTNDGLHVLISV